MRLNPDSPVPLYYQLKEILRSDILSGNYPPGTAFPSEATLCKRYGISRFTVRQAIQDLVREGLLVRRQGKGTFVAVPKIDQDLLGFYSFTREMTAQGRTVTGRVLSLSRIAPSRRHQELFGIGPDDLVHQVFRLRCVDGEPVILEKIYLPVAVCPDLEKYDLASTPVLYHLLHEICGLKLAYLRKTIEPSLADQYEAQVLGIKPGSAVLLIDRVTYTAEKKAVVLSVWVVRGDRCKMYINPDIP